ncbi:MAG: CHASE3 domain-containing protein, partial [Crocosphaera sp.]
MWNNLKLRQKILTGYSVPVIIFLLTAIYGAIAVRQVRHTFNEIERVKNILETSHDMELASSGMILSSRGFVATQDIDFVDEYSLEKEKFEDALSFLQGENGVKAEEQKQRLKAIADTNHKYEKLAERMIALVQQGKTVEAIQIIKNEGGRDIDDLITNLDKEFDEAEKALLNEQIQNAQLSLDGLFWSLLLAAIVLTGVSAAIAIIISGGVSKTITQSASLITSSSSEIAATVEQQE